MKSKTPETPSPTFKMTRLHSVLHLCTLLALLGTSEATDNVPKELMVTGDHSSVNSFYNVNGTYEFCDNPEKREVIEKYIRENYPRMVDPGCMWVKNLDKSCGPTFLIQYGKPLDRPMYGILDENLCLCILKKYENATQCYWERIRKMSPSMRVFDPN